MPYSQRIARYSLNRGGKQARRLLDASEASGPARHLLSRLIFFASHEHVIPMSSQASFRVADVMVEQGDRYFLVTSPFPQRYYVAVRRGQDWQCSCQEEVWQTYIDIIERYLSEQTQGEVA